MFDQRQRLHNAILKKKARIEEINLALAQPIPKGASTSFRRRIEQRLHIEQAVAELEAEDSRRQSQGEPASLKLPVDLAVSGDPVGTNPFPTIDLRHTVWKEATHHAQEELARFNENC